MPDTPTGVSAFPVLVAAREALDDGKRDQAALLVMGHLKQNPGEPRGLALLGRVALKTGAFQQSERFLREAIARGANDQATRRDLAQCLNSQDRLEEALEAYESLRSELPTDREILANVGWLNEKLGRGEVARDIYRQLAEKYPNEPAYWSGLGLSLRSAGQIDEAIAAFRCAIDANPRSGQAWWELASIKRDVLDDSDISTLEDTIPNTVGPEDQAFQHFALGRALHLRKQFESAFSHFLEANRLLAEDLQYNPEQLSNEVDEMASRFDRAYLEALPTGGADSKAPIFVVSLPRAGSTLVEQMLGSHSDVEALGELTHIPSLIRKMMERATIRGRTSFAQAIASLTPADRTEFGEEYLRNVAQHRRTESRHFIDKMPHNWSNILFIRHILPSAKFVEVRRAPIASGFANFSHWFTRVHSSSFSLEHIGRTYRDYVRLMSHLDEAMAGAMHHVRYEDLVNDPQPVLRATLDYLGLEWEDTLLDFHRTERVIRTPSAEQVRQPLNRQGLEAWVPYRQWLGPLFEALGPLADTELAEADRT